MRSLSNLVAVLLVMPLGATSVKAAVPAPQQPATTSTPAAASSPDTDMQPFTSAEGRFSIDLPGTPQQSAKPLALQGGGASTLHQFWVDIENDNITYMVIYNDYPPDYATASPEELLQTMRDGVVRDKKLTSDVPIDLYSTPGRAFTALDKDGWQYAVHQFLDGSRLYQLIVVNNKDHPAARTEQFLNSFRILKTPAIGTPAPAQPQPQAPPEPSPQPPS
ncbi:MAG TPA: hypothetical protein VGR47_00530 [Terracidiphilus sp.]|nr:hypothetical protein [Terracidiphilus sp.]